MDAIHADRSQKQREAAVEAFREKKLMMLICTELMSRGIDFKGDDDMHRTDVQRHRSVVDDCISF